MGVPEGERPPASTAHDPAAACAPPPHPHEFTSSLVPQANTGPHGVRMWLAVNQQGESRQLALANIRATHTLGIQLRDLRWVGGDVCPLGGLLGETWAPVSSRQLPSPPGGGC